MRKNIKRLVAVLVVMAMIISMCSTAFAAGHSKNKPSRGSHKSATKEVTNPATDPIVEESADTAAPEDQAVDETAETTPEETTVSEETNYVTETAEETAPAAEEAADDAVTVADDAEETAPAEVTYPATEFDSDEIAGVIVHVDAPEGALPEGTTMKVSKVNLDAVQDAVDKADDITGTVVAAVDITFFDANGEEIEPNTDITVTMTSDEIAKAGDPKVVHVDVKADEIEDADVAAENVEAEAEDDAVAFDADQFSVYAIVDGSTADGRYRATYYFQNADGSPYYFQNTAGETVNNQILKDGETLENVGVPNIDVTDETFNGWYYWTEDGGYGSEVQFGAVSVTGNDTIYIRANVGEVAYLTFYEDAE